MTIAQAKRKVELVRQDVRREMVWAVDRALTKAKADARAYSSGPVSSRQLARLGHPYAKRHGPFGLPSYFADPAIINRQSGGFKAAWHADPPRTGDPGNVIRGKLSNQSEVADWLQYGTETMIARPIGPAIERRLAHHAADELNYAQRRLAHVYR